MSHQHYIRDVTRRTESNLVRAVLNETLRLFPPVPMNMRLSDSSPHAFPANEKDQTPSYYVAPGTHILYITLLIQRRKDLWGDDADDFKPERWLDNDRVTQIAQNPFMFVPFHAGPRIVSSISLPRLYRPAHDASGAR